MTIAAYVPDATDLAGFREVQRLAYRCAEETAATLRAGMTEKDVAAQMKAWLLNHGVTDWFHQPFAWFGDRTAFTGFSGLGHLRGFNPAFYPGNRRLEEGMAYILDCAPTRGVYTADIGYSGSLGANATVDQLMDDLMIYRQLIVDMVEERRLLSEVSQAVDALCMRQGYAPRHKAYPFQVLAHRVDKLDARQASRSLFRFGVRNISELLKDMAVGSIDGWSPLWSSGRRSAHPPTPGLWAVEPHLGFRGVGAKWEELLVVTEDDAFWLDDDVPHVHRARSRQLTERAA
ncbi:MAG: M24 family metallopeptidase [Moraxellaceae bacterium]